MFDNILNLFKKKGNKDENKNTAKERLHLVLMQDRANVSADFLDLMKQEIIEVIKKYIEVDEDQIDVKLTNKLNGDGTTGAPALYANIPIKSIKKETRINSNKDRDELNDNKKEENTDNTDNINQNNQVIFEPEKSDDSETTNSENLENVIEEKVTEENTNNSEEVNEINTEENNSEDNADNTNNQEEENVEEKAETEANNEIANNTNESDNSKKQENGNNKKKKHGNNKTTFFDNIKVEESKTDNKTDEE